MSKRGSRLGPRRTVRAQSNVVATVLLAFLVVSGASVVVYAGSTAIDQGFGEASFSAAEESMLTLDQQVQRLANGEVSEASVSVAGSGENLAMHTDASTQAGIVRITAGGTTRTYTLGTVRYETDGRVVAYQGGGVWRKAANDEGSAVVSPPPVSYRSGTLQFPVVQLRGQASGSELRIQSVERESLLSALGIDPEVAAGTTVEFEVESEFYRAWADYLRSEVGPGPVSTNPAQQKVTVRFEGTTGPIGGTVGSAAYSDGATSTITNAVKTDSYTSPVYPGWGAAGTGEEGDIRTMDEFNLRNSPEIKGEVHAMRGSSTLETSGGVVHGQVRLGCCHGPTTMDNGQTYESTFSTKDDLDITKSTSSIFRGEVIVGGTNTHGNAYSLRVDGKPTFEEDVHVQGNLRIGESQKPTFEGDIYIKDGSLLADSTKGDIQGSIYVRNGDVTFGPNTKSVTIDGDLVVDGRVTLDNKITVNGDVVAAGPIVKGGATINGNEHANSPSMVSSRLPAASDFESPLEPQVAERQPVDSRISDRGSLYATSNNNDGPGVTGISGTGTSSTLSASCGCTLTPGNYYVEEIDLDNGDTLTLDTGSGGKINIYVENYVRMKGDSEIKVTGSGRVNIWVGGQSTPPSGQAAGRAFFMGNPAKVTTRDASGNRDQRAPAVWTYLKKDAEVELRGGNTEYTGVIYGPGEQTMSGGRRVIDVPGAEVNVQNSVDIYGAIVGHVDDFDNSARIHYDTNLDSETTVPGGGTAPGTAPLDFISVTKRSATVDE